MAQATKSNLQDGNKILSADLKQVKSENLEL